MKTIERPLVDTRRWEGLLEGRRQRYRTLQKRPFPDTASQWRGLADLGEITLAFLSVVDRDSDDQFWAAQALGQGYAGVMALGAISRGESIELPFFDRRGPVPGTGPTSSTHGGAWVSGWYGALMARDAESLDRLRGIDSKVMANSSTRVDPYHYAWRHALMAARAGEGVDGHVESAVRLANPPTRRISSDQLAARDVATFAMLAPLVNRDAAAFNEALAAALEAHRSLYAETDPTNGDRMGYLAWGPLALCCLAADEGIQVDVQSEYLLPRLISAS